MTYYTSCDTETEEVGRALAKSLDEAKKRCAFIAMRGEMGVGKTAFVRGFASYFGISGVRSPTYTVVNEYCDKARIFHFDMYRIEGEDDLYSIGYDDYVESDGYCIAEWSENIEDFIPRGAITVSIYRNKHENDRRIEIEYDNAGI